MQVISDYDQSIYCKHGVDVYGLGVMDTHTDGIGTPVAAYPDR